MCAHTIRGKKIFRPHFSSYTLSADSDALMTSSTGRC